MVSYDCQACGACCVDFFGEPSYVALSPASEEAVRRVGLPVITSTSGWPRLATKPHTGPGGETICSALAGTVGGACGCLIYEDRPNVCREFLPGSLKCQVARAESGLPVQLLPEQEQAFAMMFPSDDLRELIADVSLGEP
jgi:Fe-S-cluster containining protein